MTIRSRATKICVNCYLYTADFAVTFNEITLSVYTTSTVSRY